MRLLIKVFLGILLIVFIGLGAGYYWLVSSLPERSGKVAVSDLNADTEIVRDENGIPHIFAASRTDAFFALGYAHAQDRLWQMELMRRAGAGRLSEIFGDPTLDFDKRMRVLGLYRKADKALEGLDKKTRSVLRAYSAGVNAYLASDDFVRPPEFVVMRTRPEPWQPVDSILWGKLMTQILSGNWTAEVRHAQAAGQLSPETLFGLWPHLKNTEIPERWRRALEKAKGADRETKAETDDAEAVSYSLTRSPPFAFTPLDRSGASNAWAVSGRLAKSGKPLLANDPHLGFSIPILWYLARIKTPDFEITGATVPGVPFTVIGHNRHLAWGMTATMADQEDLYIFNPDPGDDRAYRDDRGERRLFKTREETIKVRGEDPVTLTVRETVAGPVISDVYDLKLNDGLIVSLKAAYLEDTDTTAQALFKMSQSDGLGAFSDALRDFQTPHISILYGDLDGTITYFAPGRLPKRAFGTGEWPIPWNDETVWRGYLSPGQAAVRINPPDGLIVSANDRHVVGDYPYHITNLWEPPYRADRARDLLDSKRGQITPDHLASMQVDVLSYAARDLLPFMRRVETKDAYARKAVELLRGWDGTMAGDSPEPLLFAAWLKAINQSLIKNSLGMKSRRFWNQRPMTVQRILSGKPEWCAQAGGTDGDPCAVLLQKTLNTALKELTDRFGGDMAEWRWADAHQADFSHALFKRIPLLDRWANRRIPTPGGTYTLNAGLYDIHDNEAPYRNVHGAGLRVIYDFSALETTRFMIATGQSGHPASQHYDDLQEMWEKGQYITLGQSRDSLLSSSGRRTVLTPAAASKTRAR